MPGTLPTDWASPMAQGADGGSACVGAKCFTSLIYLYMLFVKTIAFLFSLHV